MIVVIIAGGSGTRLWPLSTPSYPKHLLRLTDERTLLQNTLDRALKLTNSQKILVIPEASHVEHVYEQLPELPKEQILIEPGRRGTANCLIFALSHIRRMFDQDEPVMFLWADHLIHNNDGFVSSMLRGGELARVEERLVYIGIPTASPSTAFGYMRKGKALDNWHEAYELHSFKEKPDKKTAEKYVASGGYLWNTGYLIGLVSVFEKEIEQLEPQLWEHYQQLLKSKQISEDYLAFPNEVLGPVLSEKVTDGLVIPATFDWIDVGSFQDLHAISLQDEEGNYLYGSDVALENTSNSYIRNELKQPVAVIGLDGVVIVVNEHGILVANKNHSQKVGDVAKRLQS